jgi:hypothetical protein
VALLSILLQALYNMEVGRYVLATGEVASLGFGRIPPGFFIGTIVAVVLFYLAFITAAGRPARATACSPSSRATSRARRTRTRPTGWPSG